MSDDKRKLNKHCTGTVPKVKYTVKCRNNTGQHQYNERDNWRNLPNNLSSEWLPRRSEANISRNSHLTNFDSMDTSLEESHQNGLFANGNTASSHTSSSNSRRNSCSIVPKCDNVTKYPNKKQIEDKLNQIREYLHITTSLMTSMKTSDEQNTNETENDSLSCMIEALKDSEVKLNALLDNNIDENCEYISENSSEIRNDFDDQTNREILRETQNMSLQHLKQKGDSRLRDARQLQEKLAQRPTTNSNRMGNNLQEYDLAIADLEETTKRLNGDVKGDVNNFNQQEEESFINDEIEELQNQIQVMHNANEDRNKLIQLLDQRDAELRCQHIELQNKLTELQTKKSQVDHLVAALQNTQGQEDDMGTHVRKIVSMKDQLAKLKDMLEMVENTETLIQNGTQEEQAMACDIYNRAENLLNKDISKGNSSNQSQIDNQLPLQFENRASASVNVDNRGKMTNKNSRDARGQSNGSNSKISEKVALQAELKAKKRELEEIMGKHKASSSNLNHDVGTDNKSEFSCSNSMFDNVSGVWPAVRPARNQPDSGDRYSSDDCAEDVNEYSEIQPNQVNQSHLPSVNSSSGNVGKYGSERNNSAEFLMGQPYDRISHPFFRSPEGNARGSTMEANSSFSRGSSVSNVGQVGKQNVQKQLELIRSVCDSMLPQPSNSQSNVHHLRNNLSPSPLYSDLTQFSSPNPHTMNALNVVNPPDNAWFPGQPNVPFSDVASYQNWLTTNTLQTQAFMLNSLNQCCQMLWLQQRELSNLRAILATLQQERLPSPHYNNENQMTSPPSQNQSCGQLEPTAPSLNQVGPPLNLCVPTLDQSRPVNPKVTQVTTAASLPNLNHYNSTPVHLEPIFTANNNSRLIDSHLSNMDQMRNLNIGASENINQLQSHIWSGPALNNQVPPGNRANNYWDNFRSYSRQNLFSTKSNDGIQNAPLTDRTHNITPRSIPFETQAVPKSNSQHMSSAVVQENAPQRSCVKPSRRYPNTNIAVVPPDVLNIHQNIKNDDLPLIPVQNDNRTVNDSDAGSPNQFFYPSNTPRTPRSHSNITASSSENLQNPRRRNVSNESVNNEGQSKSKLFEELRENVYREVASLISANEARPHFLIQLFRDLQLVSSDPLRLKTLQSIQVLISQSLRSSNLQDPSPNQEIPPTSNEFSMQSTVWSPIPANSVPRNATILEGLISKKGDTAKTQNTFHEIIPFLNDNEHMTINQHLLMSLKQKIMEAKSFKKVVRDQIFQKHFSNVLDDVLNFYNDKSLAAVKVSLLQSIRDLLDRELSFMNLIQSTGEAQLNDLISSNALPNQNVLELRSQFTLKNDQVENGGTVVQIQNGDLAEADQSHVEDEDIEEEGAVGGFLEASVDQNAEMCNKEEVELSSSTEAYAASTEAESQYQLGLDQVPTRLPTKSKSRSNTPIKDRTSKHGDHPDHLE